MFWVPADARWDTIQARAKLPSIGQDIDTAMDLIEKENPVIRGVLPRNYGREGLDKGRLGQLVDLIGSIGFTETDDHGSDDVLGRVYEYFLGQFAGKETGKDAGAFYTPRSVVRTLVEMLEPFHGRVYDPCCGSGGMFVQSAKFVQAHNGKRTDVAIYGQEFTDTTWRLAKMNLALRGIEADLGERSADSFGSDLHPDLRADFVLANPPFNMSNWWDAKLADDPRWTFGMPPQGNANFAWVQHFLYHLVPARDGRIRTRQRVAVVEEQRRGRHPPQARRGRPGRLHRRDARPAVPQHRYPGRACGSCRRTGTATATASASARCCSSTPASSAGWRPAGCACSTMQTSPGSPTPTTPGATTTAVTRTCLASAGRRRLKRSRRTTSCSRPAATSAQKKSRTTTSQSTRRSSASRRSSSPSSSAADGLEKLIETRLGSRSMTATQFAWRMSRSAISKRDVGRRVHRRGWQSISARVTFDVGTPVVMPTDHSRSSDIDDGIAKCRDEQVKRPATASTSAQATLLQSAR